MRFLYTPQGKIVEMFATNNNNLEVDTIKTRGDLQVSGQFCIGSDPQNCYDGSFFSQRLLPGPQGPQGPRGPQGPQGIPGKCGDEVENIGFLSFYLFNNNTNKGISKQTLTSINYSNANFSGKLLIKGYIMSNITDMHTFQVTSFENSPIKLVINSRTIIENSEKNASNEGSIMMQKGVWMSFYFEYLKKNEGDQILTIKVKNTSTQPSYTLLSHSEGLVQLRGEGGMKGFNMNDGNSVGNNNKINKGVALEFGSDLNPDRKHPDAGKIVYQGWSSGLDIIGAGESQNRRLVTIYDDLNVKGQVSQTSDINLKKDIRPIAHNSLDVFNKLLPVEYSLKDDMTYRKQFGFIAQDVEQYYPNLISKDSSGYKSLNYTGVIPLVTERIQYHHPNRDTLCIGGECITKDDLKQFKEFMKNKSSLYK